jgi:hypothetical protein
MATLRSSCCFWAGCPVAPRALADPALAPWPRPAADPDASSSVREITVREAQAAAEGFVGSPTIRVDGADVVRPGLPTTARPGLPLCFHRRDGRVSPVPDPDDLRDALRRAVPARSAP